MAREHCDSYLYYTRYKTLEVTPSPNPFQIIFNPFKEISTGKYYRTILPQNITLSIQDVFITYMQKPIEFNENQDTTLYLPSHLEDLKHKSEYFEVPDLETRIQRHDNPHYWLQIYYKSKTFNTDSFTILPLMKTLFLKSKSSLNFINVFDLTINCFGNNKINKLTFIFLKHYQKLNAYHTSLKLNIDIYSRDPTSFNTTYFEQITLDHNFITEYSETSDNRPFITSNIPPETTPEEQTSNVLPQYTRQNTIQSEQKDLVNFFQNQAPHHLNPLYPQRPRASDIQQLNPSETATIQNASEFSEETVHTVQNTQSLTKTNDSILIQVPTHNITPNETNDQNQDNTLAQLKITPLFYLQLILLSHNHLKHKDALVNIMTHHLFHLNSQLNATLLILLNKALLISNLLMQSTFKHQLHHHLLKHKLQHILQLKVIQYKMYKLV